MLELVRRTWLPTLLFALPFLVLDWIRAPGGLPVGTFAALALIVIPPVWWLTAAARGRVSLGRGAAAGALGGALLVLLQAALVTFVVVAQGRGDTEGGMGWLPLLITLVGALCLFMPLGAAIGALTALVQGGRPRAQLP